MEPCAHVIHQTRGKVRLRVRERRKDAAYIEQAREQLLWNAMSLANRLHGLIKDSDT